MYSKGASVTLVVKTSEPRLDKDGNHKFFTRDDKSKKFVYNVEFTNGYKAEFTHHENFQRIFLPGVNVEFKVIDVNNFGPTIDFIRVVKESKTPYTTGGSMAGHPAVFALGFAKDQSSHKNWGVHETLKAADEYLEWLLEKSGNLKE